MDVLLAVFNLITVGLLIYFDQMHRREMRDKNEFIKDLELKFISKTSDDYVRVREDDAEPMEEPERNPYQDLADVEPEEVLKHIEV